MKNYGNGKKPKRQKKPLQNIETWWQKEPEIDMKIQLWYNRGVRQWRWTLSSDLNPQAMESGNAHSLKDAMGDVARTVEWMMETQDE